MKKVLLVVDYQNDFVSGSLGFEDAVKLDRLIADRVKTYLDNGDDIWLTLDTHEDNYLDTQEGKNLPVPHCLGGTSGWKLYGRVNDAIMGFAKDAFISSHRDATLYGIEYSSIIYNMDNMTKGRIKAFCKPTFGSSDLYEYVHSKMKEPVEAIEICGVITNMCVISNAIVIKTANPEFNICINKDLCASNDRELGECAMRVMQGLQMEIIGVSGQ